MLSADFTFFNFDLAEQLLPIWVPTWFPPWPFLFIKCVHLLVLCIHI